MKANSKDKHKMNTVEVVSFSYTTEILMISSFVFDENRIRVRLNAFPNLTTTLKANNLRKRG